MRRILSLLSLLLICSYLNAGPSSVGLKKAKTYHKQALRDHKRGNDSIAYYATIKAIAVLDSIKENENSLYAECLHDAGAMALQGLNDFDLFTSYMVRAIDLKYRLFGETEPYYWSLETYANGIVSYSFEVDYPRNIELLESAVELFKETHLLTSIEGYAMALNNLAVYYEYVNIYKSIEYIEEELRIQRIVQDADTLITLSNLSKFNIDIDNEKSLYYAQLVLDARLREKKKDIDAIRIANQRLASVYGHIGEYDKAIMYSEEARKLAKEIYGEESEQYARSTQNTSVYYLLKGEDYRALEFALQAYNNQFGNKSENANNLAGCYSQIGELDSCYKYAKEAWTLFSKEYIYNLVNLSLENRFSYSTVDVNYGRITQPITGYSYYNTDSFRRLTYDCILFNKNIELDCMESFGELESLLDYNVDSVKANLWPGEVAIEFWSDKDSLLTFGGEITVAIERYNYDAPIIIRLSKERIYRTLMNEYETTDDYLPLYENIWKEIIDTARIKAGERLFISLDDVLPNYPIEFTVDYDYEYMADKYEIVRVSSTRNIPDVKKEIKGNSAILYGGLNYESIPEYNHNTQEYNRSVASDMYYEINDEISSELRSNTNYLPWTKKECDSISQILCSSNFEDVLVYDDNKGTEESFKALSGKSPSVLHISTHGFSFEPKEELSWYDYYSYCMENSGLLMSGVLSIVSNESDSIVLEDGFLRSSEIAVLDLSNIDLLVLSACKTGHVGLNPVGQSGLLKAFKAAGVKSILLTLDDVDDAATYYLMVSFYKYLMNGDTKREALKKAQHELDASEFYHSIFYWGNFALID